MSQPSSLENAPKQENTNLETLNDKENKNENDGATAPEANTSFKESNIPLIMGQGDDGPGEPLTLRQLHDRFAGFLGATEQEWAEQYADTLEKRETYAERIEYGVNHLKNLVENGASKEEIQKHKQILLQQVSYLDQANQEMEATTPTSLQQENALIAEEIGRAVKGILIDIGIELAMAPLPSPKKAEAGLTIAAFSIDAVKALKTLGNKSPDALVDELQAALEKRLPGVIVGKNIKIYRANGDEVTDLDLVGQNPKTGEGFVIEVTMGKGKNKTTQRKNQEKVTGLPTIIYGPKLKLHIVRNNVTAKNLEELIEWITR